MISSTIPLEQHQNEIAKLQKRNDSLQCQLQELKEQLAWFQRQIFGPRSEKHIGPTTGQYLYFPGLEPQEQEEQKTKQVGAHERRKPNSKGNDKIVLPENLPIERQILDLPENEKVCPETGVALVKIGEEKTTKLAQRPGSYYIKEIIRPKYALPKNEGIAVASLPESLLNRCFADDSFLADMLVKKFADHLPLYRQAEILSRQGIQISRKILSKWTVRCGMALKPLYEELTKQIINSQNVFIDETPIAMQDPGKKGKTHQAYMWVMVGGEKSDPPYRVYHFRTSRQHIHAAELLKGYKGRLHSDKYGAYENLANQKQFIWCPDWAHIRRKFFEAETGDPPFREMVLDRIQELFKLEEMAWKCTPEERIQIRLEQEVPIIDELIEKIKDKLLNGIILPKSKFKEALGYFYSLIPYLKNYINHPWARLDNNVAERAVRPLAVGRKNWLFVGSEEGGEAAAVIFSLIQSCRAVGVNPREYLEDVMKRLMSHNSQKLFELLPDQWAASKAAIQIK